MNLGFNFIMKFIIIYISKQCALSSHATRSVIRVRKGKQLSQFAPGANLPYMCLNKHLQQ